MYLFDEKKIPQSVKTIAQTLGEAVLPKMMLRRLVSVPAVAAVARRSLSTAAMSLPAEAAAGSLGPVTTLLEEEAMMREAAQRFAQEEVLPRAEEMDKSSTMVRDRAAFCVRFIASHSLATRHLPTPPRSVRPAFSSTVVVASNRHLVVRRTRS